MSCKIKIYRTLLCLVGLKLICTTPLCSAASEPPPSEEATEADTHSLSKKNTTSFLCACCQHGTDSRLDHHPEHSKFVLDLNLPSVRFRIIHQPDKEERGAYYFYIIQDLIEPALKEKDLNLLKRCYVALTVSIRCNFTFSKAMIPSVMIAYADALFQHENYAEAEKIIGELVPYLNCGRFMWKNGSILIEGSIQDNPYVLNMMMIETLNRYIDQIDDQLNYAADGIAARKSMIMACRRALIYTIPLPEPMRTIIESDARINLSRALSNYGVYILDHFFDHRHVSTGDFTDISYEDIVHTANESIESFLESLSIMEDYTSYQDIIHDRLDNAIRGSYNMLVAFYKQQDPAKKWSETDKRLMRRWFAYLKNKESIPKKLKIGELWFAPHS